MRVCVEVVVEHVGGAGGGEFGDETCDVFFKESKI